MSEECDGPLAHSPQCMYRHALLFGYLACRGMIDGDSHPKASPTANRIKEILKQDWLDELKLDGPEQRFVDAPFGSLNNFNRSEASWLVERMAVLAWALGISNLPSYDTKIDPSPVSQTLGMFEQDHTERIAKATIRNPDEIIMQGQLYHVLAWRLSEFRRERKLMDLENRLTEQESPHLIVDGVMFINRDLAVNGKSLIEVDDNGIEQLLAVIHQRYKAFRWLLGYERGELLISEVN